MPPHLLTLHTVAVAYVTCALFAGAIAMLVVWLAMVAQSGLVRGGAWGWFPAVLVAPLVALGWPVLLVGVFLWREPMQHPSGRTAVRHAVR
jgi:hypothetical protein